MRKLVTSARTGSPEGVVGPRARLRALVGAGILVLVGVVGMAVPAAAEPLVDPNTLQPPPPPGAECRLDGQWIICQTALEFTPVNEPIDIELPCGTMYWTGSDARSGIRWYNADDRKLVKRFVTRDTDSVVSLSPMGAAGGLGEHPVAAGALEGVDLELGLLVGGDAGMAEQRSHAVERRRTL
jgi:hypothetical protein